MTNREEFRDLLYGTFYESISDSAIIRQQHEKIRTWVQNNIPSRLYRYRAVNDHTFDALRKDEIWGSSIFHLMIRLNVCPIMIRNARRSY